ncbi:uncharacterized protein PgNI_08069 [Pyricularia grisea]|uniref:Uncharacterized protein n=1 Tax=Pyricularia grisea TaxID=148305 RepID=A0A6P8AWC5_PYRGI|nr:uncharacterized protein PgNI_08069 [Pyricularia grisea]TLD06492.1 hypothetical protein PgNI_08069 [Pyricularia grisea]
MCVTRRHAHANQPAPCFLLASIAISPADFSDKSSYAKLQKYHWLSMRLQHVSSLDQYLVWIVATSD